MINAIIQDQYGFMWFGTNDGLNRFDGYNFTVFKNNVEDTNSIAGNFIRFLFEDSKGRLWIATANNGLDLFDRETENFIHFKHNANNPNSISSNSISSISEDKFGHIWVGTFKGLNMLSIKESKQSTLSFQNNLDIIFDNTNLRIHWTIE
jgi:ligand-binding sensor domain-containing protein